MRFFKKKLPFALITHSLTHSKFVANAKSCNLQCKESMEYRKDNIRHDTFDWCQDKEEKSFSWTLSSFSETKDSTLLLGMNRTLTHIGDFGEDFFFTTYCKHKTFFCQFTNIWTLSFLWERVMLRQSVYMKKGRSAAGV